MPLNCLNEKIYLLLISMDKIAIELSKLPFIETINALKAEIDGSRPISKEIEDKVFQKLKLDWNYNSNAIEGNKLNYGETVAFLMHGITAKGKTLKDHLDIKGHNEAINFLLSLVKEDRDISESDIRGLHKMILVEEYDSNAKTLDGQQTNKRVKLGVYKTTPNSVETRTGEMHYYASPEETPALMTDLMTWYNTNKVNKEIHPLVLASLFHFKFVAIHPFDDGNGRLARILMNLILLRNNLPVVVVKNEDKQNYYGVLAQADSNQFIPLIEYMSDLLQHSLNIYLKGIRGESIEEESDIDKEIALFKKSLPNENLVDKTKDESVIRELLKKNVFPIFDELNKKTKEFDELFIKNEIYIRQEKNKGVFTSLIRKNQDLDIKVNNKQVSIKFYNYYNPEDKIDIQSIEYIYVGEGYKKIRSPFDVRLLLNFSFSDYKYYVSVSEKDRLIEKLYTEIMTKEEKTMIVNFAVKQLINNITNRINEI